jgi:hypothetical protein
MVQIIRICDICSGTGSIDRWAAAYNASQGDVRVEVTSVDIHGGVMGHVTTHTADILTWDYAAAYPVGHFHIVHASPPCTHYSIARTRAKTPRNLELADSLVQRCLDIIAHFAPRFWTLENPASGMLRHRPVVAGLHFDTAEYCCYGTSWRKSTAFWNNIPGLALRRCDPKACPACVGGRHVFSLSSRAGTSMPGTDRWKAGMIPVPLLDRMYGQVAIPLILTAGLAPPG